jgi:hypothetical protein
MSNTLIQIRRSSSTAAPANGSLVNGEQAYSHLSDKLFIGNTTGGVIEIGGRYWVNTTIQAFTAANAGFGSANAAFEAANAAALSASAGQNTANAAFGVANAALPKLGGTISGDLVVQGNATFSGQTVYANTQHLDIGDAVLTLNADLPQATPPSENSGISVNRGSSPNVSLIWNEATDKWTFTTDGTIFSTVPTNTSIEVAQSDAVGAFIQANTARTLANTVFNVANAAFDKANSANIVASAAFAQANAASAQAANADFITSGTVAVTRGGTGVNTIAVNGILYGQGNNAMVATSAGTDGQVLQATAAGVPFFGHLDGGNF